MLRRTFLSLIALFSSPSIALKAAEMKKGIVIYYSKTGSVAQLAKIIAEDTGSDVLELKLQDPYADKYEDMTYIAREERAKNARREISTPIPDLSKYDVVYLGSPYWWGGLSVPMRTFLSDHSLAGKTVVPFCVSYSSSPSGLWSEVKEYCKGAKVEKGFHTTQNNVSRAKPQVEKWLKGLDL